MTDNLALYGNKVLQTAVRENLVTFPAQAPVFPNHAGDIQARMAHLYFVAGWNIPRLGERYGLSCEMVRKNLSEWRVRAVSSGYLQEIGFRVAVPGQLTGTDDHAGAPLRLVPNLISLTAPETSNPDDVPEIILDEIQSGAKDRPEWPSFCFRLLSILRQECLEAGLTYSAAQAARIETAARIATLRILLEEILAAVNEANQWLPHCTRLLDTVRQGCRELGMKFSLLQIERLCGLIAAPARLSGAVRELINRLCDEQEHAALISIPDYANPITAGIAT